jgi:hypothetical protein
MKTLTGSAAIVINIAAALLWMMDVHAIDFKVADTEAREIKTGWHTNEMALRNFAWGPPASNGLRAACYFLPAKDGYAVGEELTRCRVFHNSGKEPVLFKIRGGGDDDCRTALDEQDQEAGGKEIVYSTIFPMESFRLEPGQIVEMKCFYSTLLVPRYDERQQRNVDWHLWARSGRVYRAYWKMVVSVAETNFVLQTGEVKLCIVANDIGTR